MALKYQMTEMSLMELQVLMFFWHELIEDKEDESINLAAKLFGQHAMVLLTDSDLDKLTLESICCRIAEVENDLSICTSLYATLQRMYEPWASMVNAAAERATRHFS